jgi:phage gp46-like protein
MSTSATFPLPPLPQASSQRTTASARPLADVRLFHTKDGGEIESIGGIITMADGLETATYLSLFGGNEQDSGQAKDDRGQWWGNLAETEAASKYRSETQHLLGSLVATPSNLRRIEEAAVRDTSWMEAKVASRIEARATMPRLHTLDLTLGITMKNGTEHSFSFTAPWGAPA